MWFFKKNRKRRFVKLSSEVVTPKCEQESYWFGKLFFQRLYFTGQWYVIHNGRIIDHDQYRHDLEERLKHLA